ncbi:MAG TPA: thiol reductant ABC exporter subunit CydC [Roseiflexaceae bacterium]|nr:thiol reductant ABC exporter subunit CydC [Roseiflexaceae bacterium]
MRLLKLMMPFRWWIALAVLLAFGTLGASVGLMAMSAYLISKAALVTGFFELALAVTAVRALAIARAALRYVERYITHLATFRILTRLRVWLYTAVEPLAPARLQGYRSGDLLTRIVADIETLDQFYVRVVAAPLAAALTTALSFVIVGAFDLTLGVILVAFLLLTGVALPLMTRRLSHVPAAQLIADRAQLNAVLTDEIQGIADLMAFGQEQRFHASALRLSGELQRAQVRLAMVRGMSNALAVLLASLAGLTVLLLAIPLVSDGKIEGVFLALLPLTAIASFEAVQPLGAALQQLETSQAAARRLFDLIDAPPPAIDPMHPLPPPADYSIEFHNVSFRYAPDEPRALDNLSFRLPAGGRMAITGASGAGKSTLVNLLLRFWETHEGQICIGGNDVRAYHADDLRELLGVVSQHIHLFSGTIRDNLLLAKGDATDDEISAACRMAQVHDFITSLPLGYDTLVGENGLKLSGGERQRIAIARVVLKDAPILILDEATANLDALTEQKVMQALASFMRGRTTLIISHRLAGFEPGDPIIVLEHGHVE